MQCSLCEKKAVANQYGKTYCKDHFLRYVERKVFKTINQWSMIQREDNICVATSGGKDSINVLHLVSLYCKERGIKYFALAIDEGIANYRDHTLVDLKDYCSKHDVPLYIESFKESVNSTLDEMEVKALKMLNKKPCTVCGIFRRKLINSGARKYHATKVVTGHNLDDESQTFLMNLCAGNMAHNAALGPVSGLSTHPGFVQRVKPLYFISEKESRLYALLKGFKVTFAECPKIQHSFRFKVREHISALETALPGAKNGMVNAFLEILPDLKEKYKGKKDLKVCTKCGDPCTGDVCNACILENELCGVQI